MTIPFLILAILTVAGACAAVAMRNLIHCALALVVAFSGLAAMYLNLHAEFIGLAQLLVYVGAIAVLIVFAILLTSSVEVRLPVSLPSASQFSGILIAAAVFAVFVYAFTTGFPVHASMAPAPQTSIRQIGDVLLDRYILPLEVIGLMLTAALIGAVILAMKEKAIGTDLPETSAPVENSAPAGNPASRRELMAR